MQRQFTNVQYLRGLTACAIVLYHAGLRWGTYVPVGEGRVEMFFILSGFLFWWMTTGRAAKPGIFLAKRLSRLVPIYWLATGMTAVLSWTSLTSHGAVTPDHFIKSLLFIPHYGPIRSQIYPVVFPGWTLVYEMFFCLMFTAFLYVKESYRLLAATVVLGGLGLLGWMFKPADPVASTYTNVILVEFLAGIWAAALWPKIKWNFWIALVTFSLGTVLSFALIPYDRTAPALLVNCVPAILMLFGALGLESQKQKPIKWLKFVGDGSYSIYLWHIPAFFLATRLLKVLHITNSIESIVIGTVVGCSVGMVLYQVLEEPLTRWCMARVDDWFRARKTRRVAAFPATAGGALVAS